MSNARHPRTFEGLVPTVAGRRILGVIRGITTLATVMATLAAPAAAGFLIVWAGR